MSYPEFNHDFIRKYHNYDYNVHPLYFEYPEKDVNEIVYQHESELELGFPGFVDIYENLSKIIPTHFIIIDFGCYLAAQCWYFRNHIKYIGVDPCKLKRFSINNTYHYFCSAQYFMKYLAKDFNPEHTFVICNYVGTQYTSLITKYFTKCFCYFPSNYIDNLSTIEKKEYTENIWINNLLKNHEYRKAIMNKLKEYGYGND